MTMGMQALSGLGLVYIILIFCRCILKWGDGSCGTDKRPGIGIAQAAGRYRRTLPRYGTAVPG